MCNQPAAPAPAGIIEGQTWAGRGGMGPIIVLRRIDLDAGTVRFDYAPEFATAERPGGTMTIANLVERYRLALGAGDPVTHVLGRNGAAVRKGGRL